MTSMMRACGLKCEHKRGPKCGHKCGHKCGPKCGHKYEIDDIQPNFTTDTELEIVHLDENG
jgi:hypothetical protein